MEETESFETLAYKIQTPGDYPEESIQQMHNYLTNYHTATCFYTISSSPDSL